MPNSNENLRTILHAELDRMLDDLAAKKEIEALVDLQLVNTDSDETGKTTINVYASTLSQLQDDLWTIEGTTHREEVSDF
jgi:hypothetical protein